MANTSEQTEYTQTIDIPAAAGVAGYVRVFQSVLELPRVQKVEVVAGQLRYLQLVDAAAEPVPLEVDLSTVLPYGIIRNHPIVELAMVEGMNAAVALSQLFAQVYLDGLHPISFVVGPSSLLQPWYAATTGELLPAGSLYGLPVLLDDNLYPEVLVLCVGRTPKSALIDTTQSYKTTILWRKT